MQGRLCDLVNGKIQAFPEREWPSEFPAAQALNLHLMEWTLDHDGLSENPLMTENGRSQIGELCRVHDMTIPSLTGDCFMQAPFWKAEARERDVLEEVFLSVCRAASKAKIRFIVVPLVDNGRLETARQEEDLISYLLAHKSLFDALDLKILFECDFEPAELARFIERLPLGIFGINYDTGNSAALGFDPAMEFKAYGSRIANVHIKDRVRRGTTVALGQGAANFPAVFALLQAQAYGGNYIMQTARADNGEHAAVLGQYMGMIEEWRRGANDL